MIFNLIVDFIALLSGTDLNGSLLGFYALLFLAVFILLLISVSLGLKISAAFDQNGFLNPSNKKRSSNFLFAIFLIVTFSCLFVSFYGLDFGKSSEASYKEATLFPNDKEIPFEVLSIQKNRTNNNGEKILEAWVFIGEKGHGEVKVFKIDEKNSSINSVYSSKDYVVRKATLVSKKSTYLMHGHEFSFSNSKNEELLQIDVDVPKTPMEILTGEKE